MVKSDNSEESITTKNILIATGSEVTPFGGVEVSHTPVLILSHIKRDYFVADMIVCSDRREDCCVVNRCAVTGASSAKDDRHRSWCHRRRIGSFKKLFYSFL